MRRFNKSGEPLTKTIQFKVFVGGKRITRIMRSVPGRGFTPDGIEKVLESFAAELAKQNPTLDFRLVALGKSKFNFIAANVVKLNEVEA